MEDVVASLKFLVIGDSGTGKSSLLLRFTEDSFDPDLGPTIGVDFKPKLFDVNGNRVKLSIWDTAGQERFRTLTSSYYRGAHGVILVYDVSRRESFDHISLWMNEVDMYSTAPNMVKMLVGNKIDLPRVIDTAEGLEFAHKHSMLFIECSAKTRKGVQQAFEELTQKVLDTPDLWGSQPASTGIRLQAGLPASVGNMCGGNCVL
eukprot:m.227098 g.227098  ORF g.227098 m.227098 type:complete len:204 (-) comp11531_c0_seq1:83-694(-)